MPIYVYKCPVCGYIYNDYQHKYIGSRDIGCPNCFREATPRFMQRDYQAERAAVIPDWEPGYNVGIDEYYTGKADLMSKIRRKGLYPSVHGGGVVRSTPGLYGDEEYRSVMNYSEPEVHEGLENVAPLVKE